MVRLRPPENNVEKINELKTKIATTTFSVDKKTKELIKLKLGPFSLQRIADADDQG